MKTLIPFAMASAIALTALPTIASAQVSTTFGPNGVTIGIGESGHSSREAAREEYRREQRAIARAEARAEARAQIRAEERARARAEARASARAQERWERDRRYEEPGVTFRFN